MNSSSFRSFSLSDSMIRDTGMPVHCSTILATTFSSTTGSTFSCFFLFSSYSFFNLWSSTFSFAASSYSPFTTASFIFSSRFLISSSSFRSSSEGYEDSRRTYAAASSIRSTALSGRNLLVMYRAESFAAASRASSVIFT